MMKIRRGVLLSPGIRLSEHSSAVNLAFCKREIFRRLSSREGRREAGRHGQARGGGMGFRGSGDRSVLQIFSRDF